LPEEVWADLKAETLAIKPVQGRRSFQVGHETSDVNPYCLTYCTLLVETSGSPPTVRLLDDRTLIQGFNLQQRLQPRTGFIASPPSAPLSLVGSEQFAPYDIFRAGDWGSFEYWCNSLFVENTDADAKSLVQYLLQGRVLRKGESGPPDVVNPAFKIVYRWLPRTPEEREAREDERAALANDPTGPYRWLDDDEAVAVIRVLMRESFWVLPSVVGDGRDRFLRRFGAECRLPDGITSRSYLAYHATARAPEKVRAGATKRSVNWRGEEIGLNQPWSPFRSDNGWNNELLYRPSSTDNELHTTVSIAQSPVTAIDFPVLQSILYDNDDYKNAIKPTGRVPLAEGVHFTRGAPAFTYQDGRFVTTTWVYLVAVEDIYDTGALQELSWNAKFSSQSSEKRLKNAFVGHGELATTDIPTSRHLFGAEYIRVHYGETRESGMRYHLNRVVPLDSVQWTGKKPSDWKAGDPLPLAVKLLDQLVDFPMCGVKCGSSMSDEEYAQALKEAAKAYGKTIPPGVFEGLDKVLATLLSTDQPSLKDRLLELKKQIEAAWSKAVAELQGNGEKQ